MTDDRIISRDALLQQLDLLLEDYRDLQAPVADVLWQEPNTVDALRMNAKGHPAIIRGFTPSADGVGPNWTLPTTYEDILGDQLLTIAVTDDGRADSVRRSQDGSSSFVKPLEERMTAKDFLSRLSDPDHKDVLYLQSQDGNIYRSEPRAEDVQPELAALQQYFPRDIPWMQGGTGSSAEAVNLWIGTSRSVTSMHHDHYENIYHVLSGSKTFTLVSPIEGLWLQQHFHPPATLRRSPSGNALVPELDSAPAHPVPWIESEELAHPIIPIVITVHEGETLYLPSGWWHRVEQQEGDHGLAVAINYWYPSSLHPAQFSLQRLSQRIARLAGRTGVIPVDPPKSPDESEAATLPEDDLPAELLNPWGDEAEDEEWVRGER